ncbi:Prefoldin subunit 1 [Plecturocebus cupreus]
MFVLQSKEAIHKQLLEKQKIAEEKIKELERKKSYLERSVKKLRTSPGDADGYEGPSREPVGEALPPTPPIPVGAEESLQGSSFSSAPMDTLSGRPGNVTFSASP